MTSPIPPGSSPAPSLVDEWFPIETAPLDGTVIRIMNEKFPAQVMWWSRRHKRWEGSELAVMGAVKTWWDESAPQPTHWRPIPAAPTTEGEGL